MVFIEIASKGAQTQIHMDAILGMLSSGL